MSCSTTITLVPSALIVGKLCIDVADDDRGEAEADFVAQEQPWAGDEGAADGAHLLLASGERPRG